MREQKLTQFVFEHMKADVLNGVYHHEQDLPSISGLCEKYEVGRNTIRSVLSMLEAEHLISQEKGRNARVTFNVQNEDDYQLFLEHLFGKAPFFDDVFNTMEMIIPEFAQYSLLRAEEEQIDQIKKMIRTLKNKDLHSQSQVMDALMEIYLYVFSISNNDNIISIFTAMMNYINVVIPEKELAGLDFKGKKIYINRMITCILEFVLLGNHKMMKKSIGFLISFFKRVSKDLTSLYDHQVVDCTPIPFKWVHQGANEHRYVQMAADIVMKITKNVYQDGNTLPSVHELALQNHVSVRTSRKTIELLNQYQIIKTVNGVGSYVSLSSLSKNKELLYDKTFLKHLRDYDMALSTLTLCIKGVDKAFFKSLTDAKRTTIAAALEPETQMMLHPLLKEMFSYNPCLEILYQELCKPMSWSLCIQTVFDSCDQRVDYGKKKQSLIDSLLKKQDRKCIAVIEEIMVTSCHYSHEAILKAENKTA